MKSADVIVVGGGASGLIIARNLTQGGKRVIILEGRNRLGGRIHTIEDPAFLIPAEAGAEFVHGNLPVTLKLLKEAGIHCRPSGGDSWRPVNGTLQQDGDDFMGEGDLLTKNLRDLKEDMTVADFLNSHFNGAEHTGTRATVKGFVEGYDAADINRASTFALKKEWQETNDGAQYRVDGGYITLIRFLENENRQHGCFFSLSTIVKEITWQPGSVVITTGDHQIYTAKKVIITVPLGVLFADDTASASIRFSPSLTDKAITLKELGYGGAIKILLLFNHEFWKEMPLADGSLKDMGWLFSGESIPTWWTQAPDHSAMITGWLAGPNAEKLRDADNLTILHKALESLCNIFTLSRFQLAEMLAYSRVENWLADPFSLGAYSYATPSTHEAARRISVPVENTIFFAGEALYDGDEIGTVEAALANGLKVAKAILDNP
jgi:monoamine oxidase